MSEYPKFEIMYEGGVRCCLVYTYLDYHYGAIPTRKKLFDMEDEMRTAWARMLWAQEHPFKNAWLALKSLFWNSK